MHRLRKSATPVRAARADRSREERDNGYTNGYTKVYLQSPTITR